MKKTIFILTVLFFIAGVFSSCDEMKKMTDRADEVKYTSDPSPLEMHNGKVDVDISVTFPAEFFGKNAKLTITPVLKADDSSDEIVFSTKTIIGEKFEDNYPVVVYATGKIKEDPLKEVFKSSFTFKDVIPYRESMRMSDLNLKLKVTTSKGDDVNDFVVKVADGVITTPELVTGGVAVDVGLGSKVGKVIPIGVEKPKMTYNHNIAKLYFELQQSRFKRGELTKEEVKSFVASIVNTSNDPDKELKSLTIKSYASPEGPINLNAGLVKDRGLTSQKALEKALKKADIIKGANFYVKETTSNEDWDGFRDLVAKSDIKDKDVILRVLSMHSDPDVREREIKNIAEAYTDLKKDILPLLRRSILKVEYQSKAKTDEELKTIALSNPENLQKEELLFAAYASTDLAAKERIYKTYTSKYSGDKTAWNNLAVTQIGLEKLSDAKTSLEKVLDISSNDAKALTNLGAIAMAEGDDEKALEYFTKADESGFAASELGYNMGVILIKRGKYEEAVKRMVEKTFNKALAQTLSNDNDAAMSTLNSMSSEHALFYYLKAVTSAKGDDEGGVYENLKIAVAKDNKLKKYARNDMEFRKYFDREDFKDAVK